ncbi:MAG: DUF4783 domain-containing protein [Flavobacteriales bacterium]|nr:DUF4783 domain-containing protein [Flavobacteriales bacterium]
MKKLASILVLFCLSLTIGFAQEASETINTAIKVGNYKELSKYFDTKVELTIGPKEDSYSKAQAELIVKDFFAKDKVTNYQVIHRGKSPDGAQYAIGTLTTTKGSFRTYVLTKEVGGNLRIQQLRFEPNE